MIFVIHCIFFSVDGGREQRIETDVRAGEATEKGDGGVADGAQTRHQQNMRVLRQIAARRPSSRQHH